MAESSTGRRTRERADRAQPGWVSAQGHYAGAVSRFLAFVIDARVSAGLAALGLAATGLPSRS